MTFKTTGERRFTLCFTTRKLFVRRIIFAVRRLAVRMRTKIIYSTDKSADFDAFLPTRFARAKIMHDLLHSFNDIMSIVLRINERHQQNIAHCGRERRRFVPMGED